MFAHVILISQFLGKEVLVILMQEYSCKLKKLPRTRLSLSTDCKMRMTVILRTLDRLQL